MTRLQGRLPHDLRSIEFILGPILYPEGSCLVKFGNTHVMCTATVEEKVPPFLRNTGSGWITAEYGMLPRATQTRTDREASKGKQSGRTQEIQRLIGRSLRSVVDLKALGERQVRIDCDVLQADGGTRTASICGAYVALRQAVNHLIAQKTLSQSPLKDWLAAISCGIVGGIPLLDLDYSEDSQADVDGNFVMTGDGRLVEIQSTAEQVPFSVEHFQDLLSLAQRGIKEIVEKQRALF